MCGSFLCAIYKFSFIHSFILPHRHCDTHLPLPPSSYSSASSFSSLSSSRLPSHLHCRPPLPPPPRPRRLLVFLPIVMLVPFFLLSLLSSSSSSLFTPVRHIAVIDRGAGQGMSFGSACVPMVIASIVARVPLPGLSSQYTSLIRPQPAAFSLCRITQTRSHKEICGSVSAAPRIPLRKHGAKRP